MLFVFEYVYTGEINLWYACICKYCSRDGVRMETRLFCWKENLFLWSVCVFVQKGRRLSLRSDVTVCFHACDASHQHKPAHFLFRRRHGDVVVWAEVFAFAPRRRVVKNTTSELLLFVLQLRGAKCGVILTDVRRRKKPRRKRCTASKNISFRKI